MSLHPLLDSYSNQLGRVSEISLYIHIPICKARCHYCDFYSTTTKDQTVVQSFLKELGREVAYWKHMLQEGVSIPSLYIGGGTPSLLSENELVQLLAPLQTFIQTGTEVSFEMNPRDVSTEKLSILKRYGVNRISLGVQSFFQEYRNTIGRIDSHIDPRIALDTLSASWGGRVSIDLIYGIPNQSVEHALEDLQIALTYPVDHLSWYSLTYEEGTVLTEQMESGVVGSPQHHVVASILDKGGEVLRKQGFEQYEISSWGRGGERSQHNLVYWSMGNWIGIGPGASGTMCYTGHDGLRRAIRCNHRESLVAYAQRKDEIFGITFEEVLPEELLQDTLMMGLRTTLGVSVAHVTSSFGDLGKTYLERLMKSWKEYFSQSAYQQGVLVCNERGFQFLDAILRTIM